MTIRIFTATHLHAKMSARPARRMEWTDCCEVASINDESDRSCADTLSSASTSSSSSSSSRSRKRLDDTVITTTSLCVTPQPAKKAFALTEQNLQKREPSPVHFEEAVLMRASQAKRPIGLSEEVLSAHMRKCSLGPAVGLSCTDAEGVNSPDSGSDVDDCSWDADHSPADGDSLRMLDSIAARLIM